MLPVSAFHRIEWTTSPEPLAYEAAVAAMAERVRAIAAGEAPERVWLLEHEPVYTAGARSDLRDVLTPPRYPVIATGRGGEITFHGPGQRVVYVMLDVRRRLGGDVRKLVGLLESWIIAVLARLGIDGRIVAGRTGVWVLDPKRRDRRLAKIAAIGLRISRGISSHGLALNVDPDLSAFDGIVPCGIRDAGVTSLRALGVDIMLKDVDNLLREEFERRIAPLDAAIATLTLAGTAAASPDSLSSSPPNARRPAS
jgi:lipoyl(octanoyl) transferase